MLQILSGAWKFRKADGAVWRDAVVPGDVTVDHFRNHLIGDPYFGMNYKDSLWIQREDFDYCREFELDREMLSMDLLTLRFKGIDTFSDVYFNGTYLGSTEDMFLAYKFDVKRLAVLGKNYVRVRLRSTVNIAEKIDCKDYVSIFNRPRIFLRKAQCHFGWDWAPNLPGYGIWEDVEIVAENRCHLSELNFHARADGSVTFFAAVNYNIRREEFAQFKARDRLRFRIAARPGEPVGADGVSMEVDVEGEKTFATLTVPAPKLWWPNGYGAQNLYCYSAELIRDGEVLDERAGRLGLRTVELDERPIDARRLNFAFRINGRRVFAKGSNWIPADCFTGVLTEARYRRMLTLARDANFNMLRVWGGGIYEKEWFYELCDELGLMVWQDFMYACADVPEEPDFLELAMREAEYQIKRLRIHPSIVYWCGGNEKTGACGLMICHGDKFVDVELRGLVAHLDPTRPYGRQSPFSYTDVGNDLSSGDTHASSLEPACERGYGVFRSEVAKNEYSFMSEVAAMGPTVESTFGRYMPKESLWPPDELWEDRFVDNPFSDVKMSFAQRELFLSEDVFGRPESLSDFVPKAMAVHAESLRTEIEHARICMPRYAGFMNWMYGDIWPTGTWAVVDYFLVPKQAYYAMKDSFKPLHLCFAQTATGKIGLYLVNDTAVEVSLSVKFGSMALSGEVSAAEERCVTAAPDSAAFVGFAEPSESRSEFLFAEAGDLSASYFPHLWKDVPFERDYRAEISEITENVSGAWADVRISATQFARIVRLSVRGDEHAEFSDNYVDVLPGHSVTIRVRSARKFSREDVEVGDFVLDTEKEERQ